MSDATLTLEGWLSIRAALIARKRKVYEILLEKDKHNKNLAGLERRARDAKVKVRRVAVSDIEAYSTGKTHGGALALVSPRRFEPLEGLGTGKDAAFITMLDGVEDPYNFGQAIRALYAAGCHGVVVPPRNWDSAAATVARASAGASEFMPMAVANDALEALNYFKERGLQIICSGLSQQAVPLYSLNLRPASFLLIGGERRGLNKNVLAAADAIVQIPYARDFKQALDTTSSTAILAFEVMRQRQK